MSRPHEVSTVDTGTSFGRGQLGEVGALVARRARFLLETRTRSSTVAVLAHLRANVASEPGADPQVWSVTMEGVPGNPRGDDASTEERAVHAALTLFALHQQSRPGDMHQPGLGLGRAVARLDRIRGGTDSENTSPVRRRFDAVVTSGSFNEVIHHLRGVVALLRSEGVALDYGMLADDLEQFQRPGGADAVRRRWARQYYRLDPDVHAAADTSPTDTTIEEQQ